MCQLATAIEGEPPIHPRVRQRLAKAFDRAIEKVLAINFSYEFPKEDYIQQSIFRHAERGVRDYLP